MTRWLRRLAAVLGITLLAVLILWQNGLLPAPWPAGVLTAVLIAVVLAAVGWTLTAVLDDLAPAAWFGADDAEPPIARAGLDHRLGRIRHLLRDAVERDDRPDAAHELLHDLTRERLTARGFDPDADPAIADTLPPPLRRYLAGDPSATRPVDRRHLSDVVSRIEEL